MVKNDVRDCHIWIQMLFKFNLRFLFTDLGSFTGSGGPQSCFAETALASPKAPR